MCLCALDTVGHQQFNVAESCRVLYWFRDVIHILLVPCPLNTPVRVCPLGGRSLVETCLCYHREDEVCTNSGEALEGIPHFGCIPTKG